MFIDYLIFTLRLFRRDKFHSLINVFGLGVGMACCIIIMMYLQNERSYDKHHANAARIYRACGKYTYHNQTTLWATASPALGKRLKDEFPEIEEVVRIVPSPKILLKVEEITLYEPDIFLADPSVFKVFTHRFIYGDPGTSLNAPMSIVLTQTLAKKYFGDQNPLNRVIQVEGGDVKITGVIEDLPPNSHLPIKAFLSFSTLSVLYPEQDFQSWSLGDFLGYTYFLAGNTFVLNDLKEKAAEYVQKNIEHGLRQDGLDIKIEPIFQKLTDIHYGPTMRFDYPLGNKAYIYAFFSIGIFILILGCINYLNMATARSAIRAKEIGIKKALGSAKWHLIWQLLTESVLAALAGLVIAFGWVELIAKVPQFDRLLYHHRPLIYLIDPSLAIGILGVSTLIGLLAGIYPAFYLSSIQTLEALSGRYRSGRGGGRIRQLLVTFQFLISIVAIVVTLFMQDQIEFMRNKDLGFAKENVVLIDIPDDTTQNTIAALTNELQSHPDIISVTTAPSRPGKEASAALYEFEGANGMEAHNFYHFWVNHNYIKTLDIELIKGRVFDKNHPSDYKNGVIVNEKLVKRLGWNSPLGKRVVRRVPGKTVFSGEVIGVVKDFNFRSLHNHIEPMFFRLQKKLGGSLMVRIKGEKTVPIMKFLQKKWESVNPYRPFVYSFLDEEFDRLYAADRRQNQLINVFPIICILISCLGLLGLTSHNASRRIKEIAIRKVHGATAVRIIAMLSQEIFYLVMAAAVIAVPVSLTLINWWLQNFAYQTDIDSMNFVVTTLIVLAIAFSIAGYHCIRVARSNPVEALRYE